MRGLFMAVLFVALVSQGCGDDGAPAGRTGAGGARAAKKATATERAPEQQPSGAATQVTLTTSDGVTLGATLRPGADPGAPAVILVHQIASTRDEWAPIIEKLAEPPGLTILAIDLRGHGASTAGPEGATLAYRDFTNAQWAETSRDVLAAVEYLHNQENLRPQRIAAVGSSIGSTAVIAAAAEEPRITVIAAISPGRAYHGFDAYTPLTRLGERPLLAIAAQNEAPAVETATAMGRIATNGETEFYPGEAHGVSILTTSPEMAGRIDTFVRTALGPGASRLPPR